MENTYTVPRYSAATGAGTLSGAARDLGVSLNDILTANPTYKNNPNLVKEGATLTIPQRYTAPVSTTAPVAATTPPPTAPVNAGTPNPTPATTPITRYTTPYDDESANYYNNLKKDFTSTDESALREQMRQQVQGQIDQINKEEDQKKTGQIGINEQNTGRTRALLANTGQTGSARGNTQAGETDKQNQDQLDAIEQERTAKVNAILSDVDQRATQEVDAKKLEASGNEKSYVDFLKANVDKAQSDVTNLAKLGVTQSQLDPADVQDLLKHTGYSQLQLDSIWNANLPDSMKTQWQEITSQDKDGNAVLNRVGYNPTTGKTENQTYNLGVKYSDVAKGSIETGKDGSIRLIYPDGTYKTITGADEGYALDIQNKKLTNQKLQQDINAGASGSGGGVSGVYNPSNNPVVDGWVQAITQGKAKLSDITAAELKKNPNLKNLVVSALSSAGGSSDDILKTTQQSLKELNDMVNGTNGTSTRGFQSDVGSKGFLSGKLFGFLGQQTKDAHGNTTGIGTGTPRSDFDAKLNQVKNDVIIPNLTLLHGLGRVTNTEFQALSSAVTSLSADTSEKQFKSDLADITKQIQTKVDSSSSNNNISTGEGINVTDPNGDIHSFPDQKSADAFKKAAGIK